MAFATKIYGATFAILCIALIIKYNKERNGKPTLEKTENILIVKSSNKDITNRYIAYNSSAKQTGKVRAVASNGHDLDNSNKEADILSRLLDARGLEDRNFDGSYARCIKSYCEIKRYQTLGQKSQDFNNVALDIQSGNFEEAARQKGFLVNSITFEWDDTKKANSVTIEFTRTPDASLKYIGSK